MKGWIIRLLREARSDLSASHELEDPFIVSNMIIQSMKKLQKVIFFCLGAPDGIQEIVICLIKTQNILCQWLYSLQSVISYWAQKIISLEEINLPDILTDANNFFNLAILFFNNLVEEKSMITMNTFPKKSLYLKSN